jgi:hypothetical protein
MTFPLVRRAGGFVLVRYGRVPVGHGLRRAHQHDHDDKTTLTHITV